jgi:hypothetical protein
VSASEPGRETIHAHMADRIQCAEVLPEPGAGSLDRDLLHRHPGSPVFGRRAAREVDLDRRQNLAPAERRPCRAADQQHLVHVVMQDLVEVIQTVPGEADRKALRQRVADCVGMA